MQKSNTLFRRLFCLTLPLLVLSLSSCSTTTTNEIDSDELSEDWSKKPLTNFLVVAAYDRSFRITAESLFVDEAKSRGLKASPSYQVFDDIKGLEDKDELLKAIGGDTFDAILAISTLESGEDYDHSDWWSTYGFWRVLGGSEKGAGLSADLQDMGDYYSQGDLKLEITVFDATNLKPIWSATTDSYALEGGADDMKVQADFIIDEMAKRGLIESAKD